MKKQCPDEERISDYLEGRLSDDDRLAIENHLSACDLCLEGVAIGNDLVRERGSVETEPVPAGVTLKSLDLVKNSGLRDNNSIPEKIRETARGMYKKVADQIPLEFFGQPAFAPIRGSKRVVSDDLVFVEKAFKEIATEIEIEKTGEEVSTIRVRLVHDKKQRDDVRVSLKEGNREVSSERLFKNRVVFENTPFGHYSLEFSCRGQTIGSYRFQIKETPNGRG